MSGAQKHDWKCWNCVFFHDSDTDRTGEVGQCRRHAPRPLLDAEVARFEVKPDEPVILDERIEALAAELYPVWPTVTGDYWCGEFRE